MNDAGAPAFLPRAESGKSSRLIVTSGDGGARPAMREPAAAWLHLTFLRRFPGVGVFACGAYRAPGKEPLQIAIDAAEPIDFLAAAARLRGREAAEVFALAPPAAAGEAFLCFLPDPVFAWNDGLPFFCRFADGTVERHFAASAGHPAWLRALIERAPSDWALAVARAAVAASAAYGDRAESLPRAIERLLRLVHRRIASGGGRIAKVLRAEPGGMLIAGALEDADPVVDAALASLSGRRIEIETPLPGTGRAADGECGFAVFAEVGDLRPGEEFWFLEVEPASGGIKRLPFRCPAAVQPREAIEAALALVVPGAANLSELFARAIGPAVDRLWAEIRRRRPSPSEIQYGERPAAPQVSVIVPLFGRIDFLHHQIARFSNDPELRAANGSIELLYVLDDPELDEEFRELARRVHAIYGLPFRALFLNRHLGYSAASNAGAEAASGELLLLLNSDVLPKRVRWIGALANAYRALDRCGILGCRLLLDDGSIEHAGMTFAPYPELPGAWTNEHPAKGLPPAFDPHPAPARVPAVTGAALMIERALYRRLGGLCEDYLYGDFEDSDLCLKALGEGWNTYYTPEVELYHLERQSVRKLGDDDKRRRLTLYNMWKHAGKWGALIPQLLDRLPENAAPPETSAPARQVQAGP